MKKKAVNGCFFSVLRILMELSIKLPLFISFNT